MYLKALNSVGRSPSLECCLKIPSRPSKYGKQQRICEISISFNLIPIGGPKPPARQPRLYVIDQLGTNKSLYSREIHLLHR